MKVSIPANTKKGESVWTDHAHYQYELFSFLWISAIMSAVILADSFFWMPVDIYRTGMKKYIFQVYVHHIMGGIGIFYVAWKLIDVNGGRGFSFSSIEEFKAGNSWNNENEVECM